MQLRANEAAMAQAVNVATNNAEGNYGFLDTDKKYKCWYCEGFTGYSMFVAKIDRTKEVSAHHRGRVYGFACRSEMCGALIDAFPEISRSRTLFPVAKILMELTKNGDRSEKRGEIAKRLNGNIKAFLAGRHREKRGATDCSDSH